jgi:hypothetical protein
VLKNNNVLFLVLGTVTKDFGPDDYKTTKITTKTYSLLMDVSCFRKLILMWDMV